MGKLEMDIYNKETLEYMQEYLIDRTKDYAQKDFADLNWISVDTFKVKKENPSRIDIHFHRDTEYKYPANSEKMRLWLCQGARSLSEYEDRDVELLSTYEAIGRNIMQDSGRVMDGWWYTHYTEIPSRDYMFKKFYADKFATPEDAIKDLKIRLKKKEKDDKNHEKWYDHKWNIIDHATFFVRGNLSKTIDAEIDLKSFPVKYNNKRVGRAVLIETDGASVNIAVNIDTKPWMKLHSLKEKFNYDFENNEKIIDGKNHIISFNSMTIIV